ncbi:kinetochore scaffold 1 [Anaeramoeba ignava]|uniref:Kinetochore scaffold 1 n=1 Tax=Anaeramoeba ignava TaxID=1746090 RepID=A0A9Q0L7P0_ANAIG|nr:kinetochore scaffold 1 [Anaeramoeba ignava]
MINFLDSLDIHFMDQMANMKRSNSIGVGDLYNKSIQTFSDKIKEQFITRMEVETMESECETLKKITTKAQKFSSELESQIVANQPLLVNQILNCKSKKEFNQFKTQIQKLKQNCESKYKKDFLNRQNQNLQKLSNKFNKLISQISNDYFQLQKWDQFLQNNFQKLQIELSSNQILLQQKEHLQTKIEKLTQKKTQIDENFQKILEYRQEMIAKRDEKFNDRQAKTSVIDSHKKQIEKIESEAIQNQMIHQKISSLSNLSINRFTNNLISLTFFNIFNLKMAIKQEEKSRLIVQEFSMDYKSKHEEFLVHLVMSSVSKILESIQDLESLPYQIQQLTTILGRLTDLLHEIEDLEKRFPVFSTDSKGCVEFAFSSFLTQKRITVSFVISNGYPFSSIRSLQISQFNCRDLFKIINDIPIGYGLLTRICKIIENEVLN